jgi:hypothetical protein
LTLREIAYLADARRDREQRTDWYTARIVAMLAATNSKREKYRPVKWMANGRELMAEAAAKRQRKEPMTGDEILARMRALGVPIIDKRKRKDT